MEKMYYAQPQFREDIPNLHHLYALSPGFAQDAPGASLAMAVDHYVIEAYAQKADRDAACGMTAHPDITYVPIAPSRARNADEIGCGYAFNHPEFERVFDPIFSRSVKRLIADMVSAGRKAERRVATEILSIARTRYKMDVIAGRNNISFGISWHAPFEETDLTTIEKTCAFLEDRLHLHFLPMLPKRKAH